MKSLDLVVSEKKIFLCFPTVSLWKLMIPGSGPFLTPGACLAGFIKRFTIDCYIPNMKAPGLVVSEKIVFFYVFPMTPPGRGLYGPQGHVGKFYKEDLYTLLHIKYESSGPCGFRKEDFFMFSYCKSMGAICCL